MKPSEAHQNDHGPFDHVEEESPEPADADMLDHEYLEEEESSEPFSDDESIDYDAASMSDPEDITGSLESSCSPLDYLRERRSVKVEKPRVRGIDLTFDDDSWID